MVQLSDHFTYRRLLRYTFPSIMMMIFTSIYGVVDGFFVSNYVGKIPFAAVNFIMPFLMIMSSAGFLFGTGGGALIAKTMGEGKQDKAREVFSFIVMVSAIIGVLLSVIGFVFLRQIAVLLGAEGRMLADSIRYARIILLSVPFYVLQYEFQCLFAVAGKPRMGLYVTIMAGVTNMVLDALFVAVFRWGLEGAAAATAVSELIGGSVPLFYFFRRNSGSLWFVRFRFDGRALLKACTNGSSELMSNISISIVSMLYNMQLMKYAGENGVAAYGVLMYVSLIFQAVFIGYSVGVAPVVSYHYGAGDKNELRSLFQKSLILIGCASVCMFLAGQILARPLSVLFVGYSLELLKITVRAFTIFSFVFLFSGIAIYGSSFFTALNDGLTSAMISFLRTLVFQCLAVLLLPLWWKLDGIWLSIVVAEVMAVIVTILFLVGKRRKYGFGAEGSVRQ